MHLPVSTQLKYRADVDGLRALAVLPVLFFHANLGFTGGYVGVDIFFVISGFLITGLILKDLNVGQFSIVRFWERRVRRIMPPLVVVVFATLVAGWFLLLPQGFKELGESVSAQVLLVSNIYFWIKSWIGAGYFAPAAEVKPLLHTWSLAVEEQFYLLFPFLLIAIKRFSRQHLISVILVLGGLSLGLSVYSSYHNPSANFYLLPTRAWELLLGAYLAALPAQRASPRWLTETLSWGGLLAILIAIFWYDRTTSFPGAAALLPCVGAALIIWASRPPTYPAARCYAKVGCASVSELANARTAFHLRPPTSDLRPPTSVLRPPTVARLLSTRPVVFIGLISYSLYLWHWPVLVFYKYWALDPIPPSQRLLLLLASLVLAVLSWKFVEMPFRQRVILKTRSQIFGFACVTALMLLFAGLAIFKSHGMPSRLPADALQYVSGQNKVIWDHDLSLKDATNGDFVKLGIDDKQQSIDLMVWGDSHAMAAMPVFDLLCKEYSARGLAATHSATAPLVGYRSIKSDLNFKDNVTYNEVIAEFINKMRVPNVVLIARWDKYDLELVRNSLFATVNALHDSGANIWIMREVPIQHWNVPDALAATVWHGKSINSIGLDYVEYQGKCRRQDIIFAGLTTSFPNVTILDPTSIFVDTTGRCSVSRNTQALYCDDNHLSVTGAMLLRPLFEPIFKHRRQSPPNSAIKGLAN